MRAVRPKVAEPDLHLTPRPLPSARGRCGPGPPLRLVAPRQPRRLRPPWHPPRSSGHLQGQTSPAARGLAHRAPESRSPLAARSPWTPRPRRCTDHHPRQRPRRSSAALTGGRLPPPPGRPAVDCPQVAGRAACCWPRRVIRASVPEVMPSLVPSRPELQKRVLGCRPGTRAKARRRDRPRDRARPCRRSPCSSRTSATG